MPLKMTELDFSLMSFLEFAPQFYKKNTSFMDFGITLQLKKEISD